MKSKRTKVRAGAKVAAAVATVAGKKILSKLATRLAGARDAAMIDMGDAMSAAAKKRRRARTLKKVGKMALVTTAAAATVVAGRAVMKRRNPK